MGSPAPPLTIAVAEGGSLTLFAPPLSPPRLLQELRTVHWLPMDNSRCYDFPELKWVLAQENNNARGLLSRFLTLSSCILELVSGRVPAGLTWAGRGAATFLRLLSLATACGKTFSWKGSFGPSET